MTVRVDTIDTPVHVTAGDSRGLAPLTSAQVAPSESMLLKLTGASPAFTVHARVRLAADGAVVAAFGAPVGQVHTVACGSSSPRPTPVPVVMVPRGGFNCRFEAADGRKFGARIVPVPTR